MFCSALKWGGVFDLREDRYCWCCITYTYPQHLIDFTLVAD